MIRQAVRRVISAIPLKLQIYKLVKTLYVPPRRIYRHLYFIGEFKVAIGEKNSFKIRHYGFEVENELFWMGLKGYEPVAVRTWCELSTSAKIIFDVGANTGLYSLISKSLNPQAEVIALEPFAAIYEKLATNNLINGFNIQCLQLAASDSDGSAAMFNSGSSHSYSATFHNEIFEASEDETVGVRTIRIDTFLRDRIEPNIDLMKIDVEGHEPAVLRGMGGVLETYKPAILIEILTDNVGDQVSQLIEGLGYTMCYLDESAGEIRRVHDLRRRESLNYLLCSEATAKRLGASIEQEASV